MSTRKCESLIPERKGSYLHIEIGMLDSSDTNIFAFLKQILEAKGDIKAAIPILQKAAILDPDSRAIQQVSIKRIPCYDSFNHQKSTYNHEL